MPNWVYNTTAVQGPDPHLEDFIARVTVGVEEIRLADLIPLPEGAVVDSSFGDGLKVFSDTGYNTALELWGTKWGDCDTEYQGNGFFYYQTAWSPMDIGIQRISDLFPKLRFVTGWYEEDFNYGGFVAQEGELEMEFSARLEVNWPGNDVPDEEHDLAHERNWEALVEMGQIMLTTRL